MRSTVAGTILRPTAVAGSFYPADPERLRALVRWQLTEAERRCPPSLAGGQPEPPVPLGLLVPHAGLEYSGVVAAAAWRSLGGAVAATVVILGTNHRAAWLDGVGAWDRGAWQTPLGAVAVDTELAAAVIGLGRPFVVDLDAHRAEHSIEVQLPFVQEVAPVARIVPLAVATGIGRAAVEAGTRLGALLASQREAAGGGLVLAISSDMAHYPSAADAERVTSDLLPPIVSLDPERLADAETALRGSGISGLACGMCGVEPTVVGLAALRAVGASRATRLAAATSAEAGGPTDQTVGYLAVRFDSG